MADVNDPHAEYWREAFECAMEEQGLWHLAEQMTPEQRYKIGHFLQISGDCKSDAFYQPANPMVAENKRLAAKLKWERELEGCPDCGGAGRLKYNAGPWRVNTSCDKCHGTGKVHPRREREPA